MHLGVGAGELERPLSPLLAIFLPVLQKVLWRIDGQGGLTTPGDGPLFVQNGEIKKGREAARALAQRGVEKTHVFSVTGTLDPSTMELRK